MPTMCVEDVDYYPIANRHLYLYRMRACVHAFSVRERGSFIIGLWKTGCGDNANSFVRARHSAPSRLIGAHPPRMAADLSLTCKTASAAASRLLANGEQGRPLCRAHVTFTYFCVHLRFTPRCTLGGTINHGRATFGITVAQLGGSKRERALPVRRAPEWRSLKFFHLIITYSARDNLMYNLSERETVLLSFFSLFFLFVWTLEKRRRDFI